MKKIVAVILLVCMAVGFAGCSFSGPEATAEKYVEALVERDFKKMSKYSAVDNEIIFEAMLASAMETGKLTKKEVYEKLSESLDEDVESYNDLCKVVKRTAKEENEDKYGKKFKLKVTAAASYVLEENEKYAALTSMSDRYDLAGVALSQEIDFGDIKECRKMVVKAYYYEKDEDQFEHVDKFDILMVKLSTKWIVIADPTASYVGSEK